MPGNKLEQEIIRIFNRDITALLSINQISKKLNKAYPYINSKVNKLLKQGILSKANVGRSYLCSINLDSDKALALLILNEAVKKESAIIPRLKLKKLKSEFKIYTVFLVKKNFYFVLDHFHDKEAIKARINIPKNYSLNFLTKQQFLEEALDNETILSDKIILYSAEKYFEFVSEIRPQLLSKKLID